MSGEIWKHFRTTEECYEFMLAYTAQGCPATKALNPVNAFAKCWSVPHRGVRRTQERLSRFVKYQSLEPIEKRRSFIDVVERGARDSLAAMPLFWRSLQSAHNWLII